MDEGEETTVLATAHKREKGLLLIVFLIHSLLFFQILLLNIINAY